MIHRSHGLHEKPVSCQVCALHHRLFIQDRKVTLTVSKRMSAQSQPESIQTASLFDLTHQFDHPHLVLPPSIANSELIDMNWSIQPAVPVDQSDQEFLFPADSLSINLQAIDDIIQPPIVNQPPALLIQPQHDHDPAVDPVDRSLSHRDGHRARTRKNFTQYQIDTLKKWAKKSLYWSPSTIKQIANETQLQEEQGIVISSLYLIHCSTFVCILFDD